MAEYIEREALKAELEKISPVEFGGCLDWEMHKGAQEALRFVGYAVDEAPAADVAPVVHAQWENRSGIITCSKCGQGHMLAMYPHYCDNCGAKMDGVERSGHD